MELKKTIVLTAACVTLCVSVNDAVFDINNHKPEYKIIGSSEYRNCSNDISISKNNNSVEQLNYSFSYNGNLGGASMVSCTNSNVYNNLRKLNNIELFKENWNGYNAKPFSDSLIKKCKEIVLKIPDDLQPSIFPTGRSSIQMQYELADNSYLEFEIFLDKIVFLEVPKREYSKANEGIINSYEQMEKMVKQFYGYRS